MRVLLRLLKLLLSLLALVLLVTALALFTEPGLRATLDLAHQLMPGFRYGQVHGSLWRNLVLTRIDYRSGKTALQVQRLQLSWQPDDLLSRRLHITRLELNGVHLNKPSSKSGWFPLPQVRLPLGVSIDALRLNDVRLQHGANAPATVVNHLVLRAHTDHDRLYLTSLAADTPQAHLSLHGELTPHGAYPLNLQLDWTLRGLHYGPLQGSGRISGAVGKTLTLSQRLSGFIAAELNARISDLPTTPSWQASLTLHSDDLGRFNPSLKGSPLQAQLHSAGNLRGFNLSARLHSDVPGFGPLAAHLDATGDRDRLQLKRLDLTAPNHPLQLTAQGDIDMVKQTLAVHGQWQRLSWPLAGPARYASPSGKFSARGTLDHYQLALDAQLAGSELGQLAASLRATGSRRELHLTQLHVNEPGHKLDLNAAGQFRFGDRQFQLRADWKALRWPLTSASQYASPQGQVTASGNPDAYHAELQALLGGSMLGNLSASAKVQGGAQKVTLSRLEITAANGKSPLKLQARGEVSLATLAFQANGQWQHLRWPLQGPARYQSPSGSFDTSGNLNDYRFLLQASAAGANLPRGNWHVDGSGSRDALKRLSLRGRTLNGTLTGTAQARWKPALSWRLQLQGKGLDPGVRWPQLKGNLGFTLSSDGAEKDGALDGTAQLTKLSGTLAGKPVSGEANIRLAGHNVTIDTLKLRAAGAELQAGGGVGANWNLHWRLAISQLNALMPAGHGSIHSSGQVTGARRQPQAQLELALDRLQLAGTRIDRLQAKVELDISGANPSDIAIHGQGLTVAGRPWQQLRISATGKPSANELQARLDGKMGQFTLALQGAFRGAQWHGRLTQLSAVQTAAGNWQLAHPAALHLATAQAKLDQACLVSSPSRLCAGGSWQKATGAQGKVVLENLNLSRFERLLPAGVKVNNSLSGELSGSYSGAGKPSGKLTLKLSGGQLRLVEQGRPISVKLGQSTLDATLEAARGRAELHLDLGSLGNAASVVTIADPLGQGRIDGRLQAALQHFEIVSKLAPQLQDIKGHVDANLHLGGTYKSPIARGQVKLADGAVSLPQAGIRIQAIQLEARGAGTDQLRFTGSAQSGKGKLNLSGLYRLGEQRLNLDVQGQDFEALNTFSKIVVSPDLKLAITPQTIQLTGEVKVPNANIAPPPSESNRISPSSDVVIVRQANGKPPPQPLTRQLSARVRIVLGDQVWVTAGGFRGQLKGSLLINQNPQLAPRASGSVEVVAGNYKVYGQELNIERGRLLFSGGPVDNPGLDLRVSRQFDNGATVAGAQITGSLRQPQLKLFSTPSMADSGILSYLVFGHGPGSNSSSQNALLLQAATALGTSSGNFLTKGIAKELGLDLQFTGGSTPQDSALSIGRYLAPGLYVSYGIGLFNAVNKFTLRYQLSKHLSVESSSTGSSNSVDLLYTIQH